MTNDAPPSPPRNRRFLVSIWQKGVRLDAPAGHAESDHKLHGLVWEADPRDPGRITSPERFVTLSALPRILSEFLNSGSSTPEDPAPEAEGSS